VIFLDNVKCCNCEFNGLVETGETECPICHFVGALSWIDDEEQEI
jgi:RecJ-like exonuclease